MFIEYRYNKLDIALKMFYLCSTMSPPPFPTEHDELMQAYERLLFRAAHRAAEAVDGYADQISRGDVSETPALGQAMSQTMRTMGQTIALAARLAKERQLAEKQAAEAVEAQARRQEAADIEQGKQVFEEACELIHLGMGTDPDAEDEDEDDDEEAGETAHDAWWNLERRLEGWRAFRDDFGINRLPREKLIARLCKELDLEPDWDQIDPPALAKAIRAACDELEAEEPSPPRQLGLAYAAVPPPEPPPEPPPRDEQDAYTPHPFLFYPNPI